MAENHVNKATLAKTIDGVVEYIYPKTSADIVEYSDDATVADKIDGYDAELSAARVAKKDGLEKTSLADRLEIDFADVKTEINTVSQKVENFDSSDATYTARDENGNIQYQRDENGNLILDENGNPIPVTINLGDQITKIINMVNELKEQADNIEQGTVRYDDTHSIPEKIDDVEEKVDYHAGLTNNPHKVKRSQVLANGTSGTVTLNQNGAAAVARGTATVRDAAYWSSTADAQGFYTYTCTIANFTQDTVCHIAPIISTSNINDGKAQQEAWDTHYYSETVGSSGVTGGIKFYATTKPTTAVQFVWEVVE